MAGIVDITPLHAVSNWRDSVSGKYAKTAFINVTNKVTLDTVVASVGLGTQNSGNKFGIGTVVKVYGVRA